MSLTTLDGRYQVIDRIAAGGMGEVFRARDAVLAREVAIKVLHRTLAGDPGFIDRFRSEARSAALLNHPNIVGIHDWGATDGVYFMVMEYIVGHNLRELLHRHGRLEPAQTANVLLQMLAALEHAHRQGIVHRDVKPENVIVTFDGVVKVADFGLARAYAGSTVTQSGMVTGTVQYLAPEQIQGQPADPRTDLYSLGIVAYELLTGSVPFTGETSMAIAYQHLSGRVPPPSERVPAVPEGLDRLVAAATEPDRERRPPSAGHLGRALAVQAKELPPAAPVAELVRGVPEPNGSAAAPGRATTVSIPRTTAKRIRRRRRVRRVAAIATTVIALAALGWAAWAYVLPRSVEVPDVVGLPRGEARALLETEGLEVRIGSPEFSIDVAAGSVVSVDPPAGERVDRGTEVVLRLSQGPRQLEVPKVTGMARAPARGALIDAGFVAGEVTHEYHPTVPNGRVISQTPRAGRTVDEGSAVALVVSNGPPPVTIPEDLTGRAFGDVRSILAGLGFDVAREEDFSDRIDAGLVLALRPRPGTTHSQGTTVTVVVSRGPRTFPMPNVIDLARDEAVSRLRAAGLQVRVEDLGLSGPNDGIVLESTPGPGATVEFGQTVRIRVG